MNYYFRQTSPKKSPSERLLEAHAAAETMVIDEAFEEYLPEATDLLDTCFNACKTLSSFNLGMKSSDQDYYMSEMIDMLGQMHTSSILSKELQSYPTKVFRQTAKEFFEGNKFNSFTDWTLKTGEIFILVKSYPEYA